MIEAAIVGAGPYGLSIAAHFRRKGLPFRVFGPPMDSWMRHMPKGMMLKSDGFASNLSHPEGKVTLKEFCEERGIPYDDTKIPVSLETFVAYGLAFKESVVPELENRMVTDVQHLGDSFKVTLNDGEQVHTRRVILAVGITHFAYIPECLTHLSEEFVTHSYQHQQPDTHRGRRVVVIGGGASAIGLAGLMRSAGVDSHLMVREPEIEFHGEPSKTERTLYQKIRHPKSGLGPGLRSRFCANSPELFHFLPTKLRIEVVRRHLGPSGHWVSKDVVLGQVPMMLGTSIEGAQTKNGKVILRVRDKNGARDVETDHVVAGTGYRVDMERLKFIDPALRAKVKTVQGSPILSSRFESSVPGLYFVGLAAATSFGPVMRFAYGADFAARNLTQSIAKTATLGRAISPAECSVQQLEEISR